MQGNIASYGIAEAHNESIHGPTKARVVERVAPCVCEFVGTFMLAFTVACCTLVTNHAWSPTAIGSVLTVLVYAVGDVSGGHLNPSVSITLVICRKVKWQVAATYIPIQICASLLACELCTVLFGQGATFGPVAPFTAAPVAVVEVVYTAMLCFVVANCASSGRNTVSGESNQFFGLAIGMVIVAGGQASINISGAIFNPALAIGLSVTGAGVKWGFVYALFEVLAAIVAAIAFYIVRVDEFNIGTSNLEDSDYEPSLASRAASEFIGTFLLVFTFCVNVVMQSNHLPWAAAAALMSVTYSLKNVSGGHFNPAVSVSVALSGRRQCKGFDAFIYAFMQLMAGVVASMMVTYIHAVGPHSDTIFALGPKADHGWGEVFVAELLFTFLLSYVVLAVATTNPSRSASKQGFYFALAIGFCVIAGGFAGGAVSGGVMNPAVAWGIATESCTTVVPVGTPVQTPGTSSPAESLLGASYMLNERGMWVNCIYYTIIQLLGGALASTIFHCTHPHEFIKKGQDQLV